MLRFRTVVLLAALPLAFTASVPAQQSAQTIESQARPQPETTTAGTISTFAGLGKGCSSAIDKLADNCPAVDAVLDLPTGVAVDASGNVYIADANWDVIRRVDAATGIISIFAGNLTACGTAYCGDGGLATAANLSFPTATAFDQAGDMYFTDTGNDVIRKINHETGIITTVVGAHNCVNGQCFSNPGYSGDNGPASKALLWQPEGLAVDSAGNLYIADTLDGVIRKVNAKTQIITTLAGNGSGCAKETDGLGDGCPAADSGNLGLVRSVAFDAEGNIFITDDSNARIREVNATTGIITTVVGGGPICSTATDTYGDGCPAYNSKLGYPYGLTFTPNGDMYIGDWGRNQILKVSKATGIISVVAGDGSGAHSGDGGPALSAGLDGIGDIAFDPSLNFYIAEFHGYAVRKVSYSTTPNAYAPTLSPAPGPFPTSESVYMADATPGAVIHYTTNGASPTASSPEFGGAIVITETTTIKAIAVVKGFANSAVSTGVYSLIPPADKPVFLPAPGSYTEPQTVVITDGTPGAAIYYTTDGSTPTTNSTKYTAPLLIADTESIQAMAVATGVPNSTVASAEYVLPVGTNFPQGMIETIGGTRYAGGEDFNVPFLGAAIDPSEIFYDEAGDLYLVGYFTQDVRKVDAKTQEITLLAGHCVEVSGSCEARYGGDGGPAVNAFLNGPQYGAVDAAHNVYIADNGNNLIRVVSAATGKISTFAGHCILVKGLCEAGYAGDGQKATTALLSNPSGIAIDAAGDVYFADFGNHIVRKVAAVTGIISTVAGMPGDWGHAGDNGLATSAELFWPAQIALDTAGNLYISEVGNNDVRRVDAKTHIITTFAGKCVASNGGCAPGYTGNGGKATLAQFNNPSDIAFDKEGNVYIADAFNNVIRQVNIANGIVTVAAGNAKGAGPKGTYLNGGYGGDGGPAIDATFDNPFSIAFNAAGDLSIADFYNGIVRQVGPAISGVVATPAFALAPGSYTTAQSVLILDATPGVTIYYTVNGTTPSAASTKYAGAIKVAASETIKAIALKSGLTQSSIASGTYTIK